MPDPPELAELILRALVPPGMRESGLRLEGRPSTSRHPTMARSSRIWT
jgi:hypothetical protein